MSRPCSICDHTQLREITADLMSRVPYRVIEKRYELSKSAIDRHVSRHVSKALRKLTTSEMTLSAAAAIAEPVLPQMRKLNARSLAILGQAENAKDRHTALQAVRECRRNLELIARLTGELDTRTLGEGAGAPLNITVSYVNVAARSSKEAPLLEARNEVTELRPA